MVTSVDKAWMAAILDEKAMVILKKNKSRATIQRVLQVETGDDILGRRLCSLTGISPEARRVRRSFNQRPCSQHCPEPHSHHDENQQPIPDMTRWATTGIAAAIILSNLAPYMVRSEEEEFQLLMGEVFRTATYSGQGGGKTKEAIQRLSGLGWNIPAVVLDRVLSSDVPGGRAPVMVLMCGHEKIWNDEKMGNRVWCQLCNQNRTVSRVPEPKRKTA